MGRAGISDIHDVLALNKADREALSYIDDAGTPSHLPIGHQNMLKVAKIFASFCMAKGSSIVDWSKVTRLTLMTSGAVMIVIGLPSSMLFLPLAPPLLPQSMTPCLNSKRGSSKMQPCLLS